MGGEVRKKRGGANNNNTEEGDSRRSESASKSGSTDLVVFSGTNSKDNPLMVSNAAVRSLFYSLFLLSSPLSPHPWALPFIPYVLLLVLILLCRTLIKRNYN